MLQPAGEGKGEDAMEGRELWSGDGVLVCGLIISWKRAERAERWREVRSNTRGEALGEYWPESKNVNVA